LQSLFLSFQKRFELDALGFRLGDSSRPGIDPAPDPAKSFAEFLECNGHRLHKDLLRRFWSPEVLASEEAKARWVAPDLRELPA
jgi:hypothetical protein